MTEQKCIRTRRTKEQIEIDILDAIKKLVEKNGFADIPIKTFLNEAAIDPNVFYRRYETIYDVYDELTRKYDFWTNRNIEFSKLHSLGDKQFFITSLKNLKDNLAENLVMQKLLLWELTDENEITKRTASMRDTMNASLLLYYKQVFQKADFDILGVIAVMISGIYYLSLHRGIGTFCTIDFTSKEGSDILDATIEKLICMLFDQAQRAERDIEMINEMVQDGIPSKNICKYLNINTTELKRILKSE